MYLTLPGWFASRGKAPEQGSNDNGAFVKHQVGRHPARRSWWRNIGRILVFFPLGKVPLRLNR
jgi:hypothetical protein